MLSTYSLDCVALVAALLSLAGRDQDDELDGTQAPRPARVAGCDFRGRARPRLLRASKRLRFNSGQRRQLPAEAV